MGEVPDVEIVKRERYRAIRLPISLQPDWSRLPKPHSQLQVSVIVPVRDEARRVGSALLALAEQRVDVATPVLAHVPALASDANSALMHSTRYEVIVLANNCRDGTAAVARRIAQQHPRLALHVVEVEFPAAHAHVGQARASLMDAACQRLATTAGRRGIIASTDGDTQVAPDWLSATLAEFSRGADAVGGRILTRSSPTDSPGLRKLARADSIYQRLRTRLAHLIDPDPHDPWPSHHQHFGASLAVSVEAYQRAGGCPAQPWLEDEALFRALRGHGLRVRHSPQVRVRTSGRQNGRVEAGLSDQLREWAARAESGRDVRVADPRHWVVQLQCRRALRDSWPDGGDPPSFAGVAASLQIPEQRLLDAWQRADTFDAFWMDIEDALAGHPANGSRSDEPAGVTQQEATRSLQTLIAGQLRLARRRTISPASQAGTSAAGRV